MKKFRPPPDYEAMVAKWLGNYGRSNYGRGLSSSVLTRTHRLIELDFGPEVNFPRVLEVGAGTLAHLPFVRHRFDQYIASDHDPSVLAAARSVALPSRVELMQLDGSKLPFEDNSFDRVVATHVLEHVQMPHEALCEWVRVLRPGGVLSIILPCDPGLAWRVGRYFGPRSRAKEAGLSYDYYMAREHINSIFNLAQIIDFHFPEKRVRWWPIPLPIADINLIYAVNCYV